MSRAPDIAGGAPLLTIRRRADFLAARRAPQTGVPGFLLQARDRQDDDPAIRVGFTVTKKLGGAVTRNRIKRRLRAAAAAMLPLYATPGRDYVLVARPAAFHRPYAALLDDLKRALLRLRATKDAGSR